MIDFYSLQNFIRILLRILFTIEFYSLLWVGATRYVEERLADCTPRHLEERLRNCTPERQRLADSHAAVGRRLGAVRALWVCRARQRRT